MLFAPPCAIAILRGLATAEMLLAMTAHHRYGGDEKQEDDDNSLGFHLASQIEGFNVSVP